MICFLIIGSNVLLAQENFPINGVKDKRNDAFAFTNATIFVDYKTKIEGGTLLIKNGKVERVTQGKVTPSGYTETDCTGQTIYPSFIDLNTNYGMPDLPRGGGFNFFGPETIEPATKGPYNANDAINADYQASRHFKINEKSASAYRKIGFGTVLSTYPDGIARGSSALVTLNNTSENEVIIKSEAAAGYSFNKGTSKQNYPFSAMGAVALLRQTYMDAKWYNDSKPFTDLTLTSWNMNQKLPQIFDAGNKYGVLRADKVGDEFGVQYIMQTKGDEYQRVSEIKRTNASLIVPVNFPSAYSVDDPYATLDVTLTQMKHWELAPSNLKVLTDSNINVAITTSGLKNKNDFLKNIQSAIKVGLGEEMALKALTYTPASLIKAEDKVGSLSPGRLANFIIASGNIFSNKTKIYQNWIQGKKYEISKPEEELKQGNYILTVGKNEYKVELKGKKFKIIVNDSTNVKVNSKIDKKLIRLSFKPEGSNVLIRLSGWQVADGWKGQGQLGNGSWVEWALKFNSEFQEKPKESTEQNTNVESEKSKPKTEEPKDEIGKVIYPFVAYGQETLPKQEAILIKNATVWTNENDGVLKDTDVLLQGGKIKQIGKGLSANGAKEIDGSGKHLTAGIIDEHSHIALFSVNDLAVNSGMVRMKDVINPEDIKIYQQLAGGVTSAQLLHGSANPVGGQSALIKLKWGESIDNMVIQEADEFIKFALGENVKRSRSPQSIRYPLTRMGVEQVYVDAFSNALAYERDRNAYNKLSSKERSKAIAPRRDLVHEAMLEILREKRFITCHSYVQSEINMLMKVAESFNFNVNTFTHILEGYKVADKMKEHGVGASTFADWWAYKWEVRYAIPYNPTLMHNEGVTVAINSDDGEMGRRLNQEAAKSVKYGNMSEEDALKMVTLNPAKLLHLDKRTGSIKVGKDADVVLWNDHPLSIYAKPLKTIIEGVVYYDVDRDEELRDLITKERSRLVQKMKNAKTNGRPTQAPKGRAPRNYHCDDLVNQQ